MNDRTDSQDSQAALLASQPAAPTQLCGEDAANGVMGEREALEDVFLLIFEAYSADRASWYSDDGYISFMRRKITTAFGILQKARAASPQPVAQMERAQAVEQPMSADDADMVWPDDDGETFFHTIDDAVEAEVNNAWPVDVDQPTNGELELKLTLAKRIPTATIRIFNITENGHEWEIVQPAQKAEGNGNG